MEMLEQDQPVFSQLSPPEDSSLSSVVNQEGENSSLSPKLDRLSLSQKKQNHEKQTPNLHVNLNSEQTGDRSCINDDNEQHLFGTSLTLSPSPSGASSSVLSHLTEHKNVSSKNASDAYTANETTQPEDSFHTHHSNNQQLTLNTENNQIRNDHNNQNNNNNSSNNSSNNINNNDSPDFSFSLKCGLLGDGNRSGKSSILNWIQHRSHCSSASPPKTFSVHRVLFANTVVSNTQARVQFLDIAGQRSFDPLRHSLFNGVHVFLVAFSLVDRISFENIKNRWLPFIRQYPDVPVVLIGTKKDLRENSPDLTSSQRVTGKEARALAEDIGAISFAECSAATGEGMHKVLADIVIAGIVHLALMEQREQVLELLHHHKEAVSSRSFLMNPRSLGIANETSQSAKFLCASFRIGRKYLKKELGTWRMINAFEYDFGDSGDGMILRKRTPAFRSSARMSIMFRPELESKDIIDFAFIPPKHGYVEMNESKSVLYIDLKSKQTPLAVIKPKKQNNNNNNNNSNQNDNENSTSFIHCSVEEIRLEQLMSQDSNEDDFEFQDYRQRGEKTWSIYLNIPEPGQYILSISADHQWEIPIESSNVERDSEHILHILQQRERDFAQIREMESIRSTPRSPPQRKRSNTALDFPPKNPSPQPTSTSTSTSTSITPRSMTSRKQRPAMPSKPLPPTPPNKTSSETKTQLKKGPRDRSASMGGKPLPPLPSTPSTSTSSTLRKPSDTSPGSPLSARPSLRRHTVVSSRPSSSSSSSSNTNRNSDKIEDN